LRNNLKSDIPECQACWLRRICRSCPGLMFKLNGAINQPVAEDCLLKQGLAEGTLLELARLREDPVLWGRFVAKVKQTIQAMSRGPRGGRC
jgi:sulfatase maturation enzyme AslB (radical SAM superfamily)